MKLTLIQTDILWLQPSLNMRRAEAMIADAEKSDVYILPEMFTTGFAVHPEGKAEDDEAALSWMKDMARRYDAAIGGSVAVKVGDGYRNRFYFVMPDGSSVRYGIWNDPRVNVSSPLIPIASANAVCASVSAIVSV